MDVEPRIAFVPLPEEAGLEVRINFGVFAGRDVTPAELDELGRALVLRFAQATVVAENRHEIGGGRAEASLHQVRVEVPLTALPTNELEREQVSEWLVDLGGRWARTCIEHRQADTVGVSPLGERSHTWEEENPSAVGEFTV